MRSYLLIIAMVFTLNVGTVFASDSSLFDSGMQAFKAKNYRQAIQYFNQAKASGYNRLVIEYNLGVSHFKLGQYLQAEKSFQTALASEKLKPIIQYNLGLVKLKQRQKREALEWFKKAASNPSDPKISALANRMISKYRVTKKRKNFIDGGINIAYGHDSNVTQVGTDSPSQRADDFLETYAYLNFLFRHVDLKFSYYNQDYATDNPNDYTQLGAALAFPIKTGKWRITPSLLYTTSELDRINYQSASGIRLDLKRYTRKRNYLRFRYQFNDIESDTPDYNYLDGTRHRFRTEYLTATGFGQIRLRYEYEMNDRQNTAETDYSPTRHSVRLRLRNTLPATFKMKNEILFRNSVYEAESTSGFIREDDRFQYRFNIYASPTAGLELGVRYTYTDNSSNDVGETFTRNVTQGYLSWYF